MGNLEAAATDGLMQIYEAIGSENVTGFINTITDGVSKVIPPIKKGISWLKDNLPTIAPLLTGIATALGTIMVAQKVEAMVTAFKSWKTATEGMTVAQKLLNAAQLASPVGLVIGLIAGLIAAIVVLWNTNDGFREAVMNVWNGIKDFIGDAIQAIGGFFSNLDVSCSAPQSRSCRRCSPTGSTTSSPRLPGGFRAWRVALRARVRSSSATS